MPSVQEPPDESPYMRRALDLIQASVQRKRLIAAGVRWGQTHEDVDSLVEGRCAELVSSAAVLEAQVTKYRDEMGDDACLTALEAIDDVLGKLLRARAAVLR